MTDFVKEFNSRFHQPHPLKAELKELGYRQAAMAKYLNITPAYLYQLLGGYCRMPDRIQVALESLIVAAQEEAERDDSYDYKETADAA